MSNTETHAVTGRSVRRFTGRPGHAGEHPGRRSARIGHSSPSRSEGAVLELTLLDVFESTVARWGERPAVDAPRGVLSYNDLAAEVDELADRLRADGVGPGDRVGVRVPSGKADLYVAILGVLAAGAAYVPVDADDPDARAEQIFTDAGACAVIGKSLEVTWRGTDRRPCRTSNSGRRRLDHLHLGLDRQAEGRGGPAPGRRGVRPRRGRPVAGAARRPSPRGPVRRVRRELRGDVARVGAWRRPRPSATRARALRCRARPLAQGTRHHVISTVPTLAGIWDDDALASSGC